jgi:hypothetical protein
MAMVFNQISITNSTNYMQSYSCVSPNYTAQQFSVETSSDLCVILFALSSLHEWVIGYSIYVVSSICLAVNRRDIRLRRWQPHFWGIFLCVDWYTWQVIGLLIDTPKKQSDYLSSLLSSFCQQAIFDWKLWDIFLFNKYEYKISRYLNYEKCFASPVLFSQNVYAWKLLKTQNHIWYLMQVTCLTLFNAKLI